MKRQKILLAIGYREMEEYLKERLEDEFEFVGEVIYREGIIKNIELKNPDIVVIRESLVGNISILSVVNKIRTDYPNVRIVFLAKKRVPGDKLLSLLVSYGVYDILHDQKVIIDELIGLIRKPNDYRDVSYLLPSAEIDEVTNQVIFNATGDIIKEIVVEESKDRNKKDKVFNKEVIDKDIIANTKEVKEKSSEDCVDTSSSKNKDKETLINISKNKDNSKKSKKDKKDKKEIQFPLSRITQPIKKTTKEGFNTLREQSEEKQKLKESEKERKRQQKEKEFLKLEEDVKPITAPGKKIVTFLGGTRGVGNTSLALNFAIYLAQNKEEVIYVELNEDFSAVNYWFNFNFNIGIDSALDLIKEREMSNIDKQIITKDYLLKNGSEDYKDNYKKFPSTLDFMTYSKYKDLKDMSNYNSVEYKDLLLYLLFQKPYSYVILDINTDIDEELLSECLFVSGKIYITITQDIKSIGNVVCKLNNLDYKNNENIVYVVNKYNKKAMLNDRGIKKWLETKDVIKISDYKELMLDSNYIGLPFLSYAKDKSFEKEISQMIRFL